MRTLHNTDELDALPNGSILLVGIIEGDDFDALPCQKTDDAWWGIGMEDPLGHPKPEAFANGYVRLLWEPIL